MHVQIYEALVIRQGLARITVSLYDGDTFQGEYELAIEVSGDDTIDTLKDKIRKVLNTVYLAPTIVYSLPGVEFDFEPTPVIEEKILPDHKKANAE